MIKEQFRASFTGALSALGRWRFNPPLRVEKGKRYQLTIDQVSGKVRQTELPVAAEAATEVGA
jgi:hypothetical protein